MNVTISNLRNPVLSGIYRFCSLLVLSVACLITSHNVAIAGANLMVTPTRVIFEEGTRTAQVTLLNTGTESGNFRITFIRQQMTENGEFVKVKANEKGNYSDHMIRYSPRQASLAPGQPQIIRLMLRKPKDLADGEYRSHMLFQSIPKPSKRSLESAVNPDQEGITVEIVPIVGVSIPVIVRKGKLSSEVRLSDARIQQPTDTNPTTRIAVTMHRTGTGSAYGDFRAIYKPKNGEEVVVGLVNGVSVYAENDIRQYSIPLSMSPGFSLDEGELRILYLESEKNESNGLIAETALKLD